MFKFSKLMKKGANTVGGPENLDGEEFQDWVMLPVCYSDTYWTTGILQPSSMGQRFVARVNVIFRILVKRA